MLPYNRNEMAVVIFRGRKKMLPGTGDARHLVV